jgi:AbiV family abortive infection protein
MYIGKLSAAQIADGINSAIRNAKRLAKDSDLMFKNGRYPSAASLAILSIEESGKISILRCLALAKDEKKIKDVWRDYRSHTKKNVAWLLPELVGKGAKKLDDFRALFDEKSDHPYILDQIKQIGFYTDCLGKANWSEPHEIIDEALAKMLVNTAKIFAKDRIITKKEIELWIKHLGPVWNGSPEWMKKALENWYSEMQEHGLAPEGKNAMEEFIQSGMRSK